MKNLELAAQKLILLIEGQYDDIIPSPWGMEEYNHYDEKYLQPLSEEEKISVFYMGYNKLKENDELEENIKQIFYLSSCFGVKFSKEYINILRNEKSEIKKRIFFEKTCYYIQDRWSKESKLSLPKKDRELINSLCNKYNIPSPIINIS
ncbi:hypothetical protein SBX64_07920 [Vibrio rhizosphaerae]|uniref:Uncharacterized protein n=1 Tax=Vibrio rhizosphaerae TaxID=398736 RepID=A0ABU4ISV4_9VIBR|nr:hypothetical protein [Vibrio rhizosphaerae]MDW6092469.1 hypothetical protein [Vibrio rhizosphaerae]